MSKSRLIAFLFLAKFSIAAPADSIRGTVVDPSSRAIEGARVTCGGETRTTDAEGRFVFESESQCDARVSFPGFAPQTVSLAVSNENRVTLAVAGVAEQVVVSATRADVDAERAGIDASVITSHDMEQRRFPAILDYLRDLPGLSVVKTGRFGGLTDVYTRGASSTGTLVLLDGIPLTDPGGQIDFGGISAADIDHVEVVRGPESTLFGAEAAAGVIQIFTKHGDAESDRPHGSVTYERGSFQTDHWGANVNGGLAKKVDYSLGADQFHSVGEYQNDGYRNTTGTANIGYRISANTVVRAIFRERDSILGTPGQTAYGLFDLGANEEDRDTAVGLRLDDTRGQHFVQSISFGYHRERDRFNDGTDIIPYEAGALLRTAPGPQDAVYLVRLVSPQFPPPQTPAGETLSVQDATLYPFPGMSVADRMKFDYQGTLEHYHGALVFGYDYERQAGDISETTVTRRNNGFFAHEQQALTARLFVTGGARLEQSSVFGTKFTPRASASFLLFGQHGPMDSTSFQVSAGRGITEPSLLQNFARESFYVGNPGLRPEKTATYEAGIVQEWFGRRLRTEVEAFRNSFTDLITFDSSAYPGTWRNVAASWARGVEVSATARVTGQLSVTGSYTRLYTRITNSLTPDSPVDGIGQELLRQPRNAGAVSATYAARRWSVVAGGRFFGERHDSDFLFGITRNPGYQHLYVSGSYQLNSHVAPFVRVENLLDESYQEVLGYNNLTRNAMGGVRLSW
ncbi:MAG: TonB-dependent receptor [Bryobacteraceae bacterium]